MACMQMTAVKLFEGFILGVLKQYEIGKLQPPNNSRVSAGTPCQTWKIQPGNPSVVRNISSTAVSIMSSGVNINADILALYGCALLSCF